jgi:hypothetical protein
MTMEELNLILSAAFYLRNLKVGVLEELKKGTKLGLLQPSIIRHMVLELDYFVDKLNGRKFTVEEEAFIMDIHNEGVAELTSELVGSESKLSSEGKALAMKIRKLEEDKDMTKMFVELSLEYAAELDDYQERAKIEVFKGAIKSDVHPIFIAHEIREMDRFAETLDNLGYILTLDDKGKPVITPKSSLKKSPNKDMKSPGRKSSVKDAKNISEGSSSLKGGCGEKDEHYEKKMMKAGCGCDKNGKCYHHMGEKSMLKAGCGCNEKCKCRGVGAGKVCKCNEHCKYGHPMSPRGKMLKGGCGCDKNM